ncbi:UDP-galactopyranose mutase Glf [methanogenic archaeon ISO4-H5]|nr:UDP-galactopyranose mutase Glf [methanogenic archaeon ISO4-H5]
MEEILVIGAGISGAVISNLYSSNTDTRITVIDRRDHIAGNCYDYRDENSIMIHRYGSHIFHTSNEDVWNYLIQFTGFNDYIHKVVAVIDGKEVHLPFNLNSIHAAFPEALASKLEQKLLSKFNYGTKIPIKDFMEQDDEDLRFLTQYIYENVFLHYTEKQWGKDPSQIDGAVTARVPVYLSRDDRYFQNTYQGIPLEGYTAMIERLLDRPNITVKLNTDAKGYDFSRYDEVFFTGAVDELMDYQFGQLPYRSVHFELEAYDREHYQSGAVVNYPNNYDFTRIHEYKYYLGDRSPRTVIAKEYSEDFVPGKNDRYYPVPSEENAELYNRYLELAREKYPNMHFLGRLGDYKYYDMDKAVKRALDLYRELNLEG